MLLTLATMTAYIQASTGRRRPDETGQSEVTYLLVVIGAVGIAAVVIAAILALVNGKIAGFTL